MWISICFLCKLINYVSSKLANFKSRNFFSKLGPLVWQLSYDHWKKPSSSLQTDSREIIPKTQSVPRISLFMFYTSFQINFPKIFQKKVQKVTHFCEFSRTFSIGPVVRIKLWIKPSLLMSPGLLSGNLWEMHCRLFLVRFASCSKFSKIFWNHLRNWFCRITALLDDPTISFLIEVSIASRIASEKSSKLEINVLQSIVS